jgi:gamma-glutamylcysteine synthetase
MLDSLTLPRLFFTGVVLAVRSNDAEPFRGLCAVPLVLTGLLGILAPLCTNLLLTMIL